MAADRNVYAFSGAVGEASLYNGVKVQLFPEILEAHANFKLGTRHSSFGAVDALLSDLFGSEVRSSHEVLANNVYAIGLNELVKDFKKGSVSMSSYAEDILKQVGLDSKAFTADSLSNDELVDRLSSLAVTANDGRKVPAFKADETTIVGDRPALVFKVFNKRQNRYIPIVRKDRSIFSIGQDTIMQELNDMSAINLYTERVSRKFRRAAFMSEPIFNPTLSFR